MLNSIIRLALRYRLLVVVLCLIVLVWGSWLSTRLPIDVFPDLDRPRVIIIAECQTLATEEVETLVTQPIENALLGAAGIEAVRSQSAGGLSVIYAEFGWEVEVRAARQIVQERLSTVAEQLPEGIRPLMTPPASIMGQIVIAGLYRQAGPEGGSLAAVFQGKRRTEFMAERPSLTSRQLRVWRVVDRQEPKSWQVVASKEVQWNADEVTFELDGNLHRARFLSDLEAAMELRSVVDWQIRPRLLKIPGVAEIFIQGGERKQYQVLVDPAALHEFGVTLQQVEQALRDNNRNGSGGFALTQESERPVRMLGRLTSVDDIRKIPVTRLGQRVVTLNELARVVVGPEFKRGDGSVNGVPGIVLTIAKQPHADTRTVTEAITKVLTEIESSLPADVAIKPNLFQLKNFIDRGIFNVGEALVIGAVLVLIVLFLFLFNLRTTFITLTAIPLSLVITTLVFRLIGNVTGAHLSINVMTLGGIAVAMGELVDDAIVDVENIYRRLRENVNTPVLEVIYQASVEVRSAIVFGTAVVILVFLPIFALEGIEGRLFAPLAVAYIVSILASLVVSLTVTPVLSSYLLSRTKPGEANAHGDGVVVRWLKWLITPLIRLSLARAGLLLLMSWALFAVAAWKLSQMGRNFLPAFDEGSVQLNVTMPPGSSLQASNRASAIIDGHLRTLQQQGQLLHFVRRTGRAELDEHAQPVNMGEYILSLNPEKQLHRDEFIAKLLHDLREQLPGVDLDAEQPLAHLISHMLSGVSAQIAIKIFGDDMDALRRTANQIKTAIADVPGLTTPMVEPIRDTDELHIRLRPDDLTYHGISRESVSKFLQTAFQGEPITQMIDGQKRFDVVIRLEDGIRTDYANLGKVRIDLGEGRGQVELREIATIETGLGPNAVYRENARRRIVVRCNAKDRDLASLVREIRERVADRVDVPSGYFVEYGGQFESEQRASFRILLLAGLSILGMFIVLLVLYPSVRVVLQILNALPTAFIGGVFALAITGQGLTVAALVGFISLGGIAVRNGILLVTHYFHLMQSEGECFTQEMILRGSLERLSPVLMTALTAGIGLIPLVIAGNEPGREILYPVATVILGGLVTSTFCEFLIHPGLFWKFSGHDAEALVSAAKEAKDKEGER
jgi:HME family heavy-metal exporter